MRREPRCSCPSPPARTAVGRGLLAANSRGDPAAVHHQDPVAHGQQLRHLGGDQQDARCPARSTRSSARRSRAWRRRRRRASARPSSSTAVASAATWPGPPSAGCRPTARRPPCPSEAARRLERSGRPPRPPARSRAGRRQPPGESARRSARVVLAMIDSDSTSPVALRSLVSRATPRRMARRGERDGADGRPSSHDAALRPRP